MAYTPSGVGFRQTDTSKAAAESVDTSRMRLIVLRAIDRAGTDGITADEIGASTGLVRMSVQPRCSDLRRLGKVGDSGKRGRNASGRLAIKWVTRANLVKLEGQRDG